jgi:hypothetical protein
MLNIPDFSRIILAATENTAGREHRVN